MAYQTYTTDAIVCGSANRNTSDRALYLFTRDAGMVIARAKSVRDERSKLRYALQDFSVARTSLVRGKHDWRITGVEPGRNFYFETEDRASRASVRGIVRLVRRLIPGEEAHPRLYEIVEDGLRALAAASLPPPEMRETFVTLRVLHTLGYIAPSERYHDVISAKSVLDLDIDPPGADRREPMHRAIEEAFAISHL